MYFKAFEPSVALTSLLGAYGKIFEQRLYNLDTIQQMPTYIEDALLSQLQRQPLCDSKISAALDMIWRTNGQICIQDLAEYVGLSLRHFERRFTKLVGLYPKRR